MDEFTIWVAGIAQPQGSTKPFRGRGKASGKIFTTSDNVKLRPWRHAVTSDAQDKFAELGGERLTGPVELFCLFYFPRPQFHVNKAGRLLPSAPRLHTVKPDLSKLVRAVEDSLTDAGIWRDDNQVVRTTSSKNYADHCPPGAHITVRAFPTSQPTVTPGAFAHGTADARAELR